MDEKLGESPESFCSLTSPIFFTNFNLCCVSPKDLAFPSSPNPNSRSHTTSFSPISYIPSSSSSYFLFFISSLVKEEKRKTIKKEKLKNLKKKIEKTLDIRSVATDQIKNCYHCPQQYRC